MSSYLLTTEDAFKFIALKFFLDAIASLDLGYESK